MTVDRADLVAHARSLAGLTADTDPSRASCRARYLATVAPGETPERATQMALMSGCELVALRGYLGHFATHPLIDDPYITGMAGRNLLQVAREAHAVRPAGELPEAGDVVIVGGGVDGGGPEHAWIAVEMAKAGADASGIFEAIEGGQRDAARFECIVSRVHRISHGEDQTSTYRRRVRFVLNAVAICEAFPR